MIATFDIHNKLGLNQENGLFVKKEIPEYPDSSIRDLYEGDFKKYKIAFKAEYALKKIRPDSFFLFNNQPLLLFFDYSAENNLENLSKDIWNFNKSALVFVSQAEQLNIYNGFKYEESGLLQILETIRSLENEKLQDYSYWKVVTAELWNTKEEFTKKTRVDVKLLENIKTTRDFLISKKLSERHANRIIGRLIFLRYLIDRKVNLDYNGNGSQLLTKEKLPELILRKNDLFAFFQYLLTKFKGDILPLNGEQNAVKQSHLEILSNLFAGNNIKQRQRSLFNVFDFDFIPIEFISNIYETFLGKTQDKDKAFYTPPFLVDYVLEETVKPFVAKQNDPQNISCKTVDFTCGSGIFLCEALRTIINRYIELAKPDRSSKQFKEKIKLLLTENIFGNDINQEAVEIAKLSLFITLLDYFEDPKHIEGFEFPTVSDNFYTHDVFDDKLNRIFGEDGVKLDFIIGNPPWGKIKKSRYLEYCVQREKKENSRIKISNNEFAQAFLLRLSDFSTKNTCCQIIVTSKLLYNLQADKFRNYFLKNYLIDEVLEISSVRHQIFSNAVGPAAVIKYKYAFGNDTKDKLIEYVSLKPNPFFAIFKTILIEKYDYKEIIQNELIKNDWLWKTLVYGHILEYKFIERLRDKNKFPVTLGSLIQNKDNNKRRIFAGTGIKIGNKRKKNSVSQYKNWFFINTDKKKTTNKGKTERISDLQRFYIYFDEKNNSLVENLSGILNSDLTAFFILNTGHSLGVERERMINKELFYIPIIENAKISLQTKQLITFKQKIEELREGIEKLQQNTFFSNTEIQTTQKQLKEYEEKFKQKELELNELIFNLYNLSETERDLIAYAQEITIPILQARNKKYKEISKNPKLFRPYKKVTTLEITDYINIFKEHFSQFHNGGENGYFNVRIFKSKNILAMEFYIDDKQHNDQWSEEPDNQRALELLAGIGFQKVSSELFIQKDVKTLNRKSFSVLKINQYKYWHKAIARLDIIEFSEAMVQSRIQFKNGILKI